jgi:plasmid stabilization system protein ParE
LKPVRFLKSARDDVRREKHYYRRISPDLAKQFQHALEIAVKSAAKQPLAMQVIENEIRRWPLNTFPHEVLYRNQDDFILVLAVFHPKQAPERWQSLPRT